MKNFLVSLIIFLYFSLLINSPSRAVEIFFTDGDSNTGFIVDVSNSSVQTFSLGNGSFATLANPGYPLTVSNNQILIGSRNGLGTNTYSLSGTLIGQNIYPGNANFEQLLDGTTDGVRNYAVRCCGGDEVIVADLDWQNPRILFNLTAGGSGIAYDSTSRTLWVLNFNNEFINYSLTGQEISRFTLANPPSSIRGLSYDPRTNSLWFVDITTSVVYNYSTAGVLLSSNPISGLQGFNIYGGEIAFVAFPMSSDTFLSIGRNALALRNTFNLQSAKISQGLTYDCTVFDANNMCVSFAGTRSYGNDGIDNTTGALIIAHRPTTNIRVGVYVDQTMGITDSNGLKVKRGSPGYGVFGVWSQRNDDLGTQVRVAANSGSVDIETTRLAIGTAEAGFGQSNIKSNGVQLELSQGYAANDKVIVRPYVAYRQVTNKRAAYTESSSVDFPLVYSALKQTTESVLVGSKFFAKLTPKTTLNSNFGFEHDVKMTVDNYQAANTDIGTIAPINMSSNVKKSRPVFSVGVVHALDKTQTVGFSLTHRKEALASSSTWSAYTTYGMLQYSVGF